MPNFICREDVDLFLNDLKWKVDDNQRQLIENIYEKIHRMATYNDCVTYSTIKNVDWKLTPLKINATQNYDPLPPPPPGYHRSWGWNGTLSDEESVLIPNRWY